MTWFTAHDECDRGGDEVEWDGACVVTVCTGTGCDVSGVGFLSVFAHPNANNRN